MRKALFFLGILNDSDIEWLIATGVKQDVGPAQVLIHEGKPVDSVFLVLSGRLSVRTGGMGNREVGCLQAGEIASDMLQNASLAGARFDWLRRHVWAV